MGCQIFSLGIPLGMHRDPPGIAKDPIALFDDFLANTCTLALKFCAVIARLNNFMIKTTSLADPGDNLFAE